MSNDITPKPKFHGQEVRDETTIRRPTHQGCLIHTKELEKHAPVREPSTPRTIVPRGRGSDDGLPREDRTTWFVTGSRQRAARRAAVSAHMALDVGVDCRCRGDLRPYWGAADPSDPLGPPQSAAQVGPPQTHLRLSNRRYREERIRRGVILRIPTDPQRRNTMARGRRPPIAFATGSQTCMVASAVSKPQAQRFKVIGNQWSNTLRGRSRG
jgi:hypothetical protein